MMTIPQLDFYDLGRDVTAFSTTRHGGCSTGNYASFNINRYCGDQEEHILRNREALCQQLGISDDHLVMPHQVHQTRTIRIDGAFLTLSAQQRQEALEGYDALMTDLRCVCIGVSTADCIPILLYDEPHHAVCAIHAGWRGTVARIAEKTISAMTVAYGTQPSDLKAQIGPGIHFDSFEVGNEVYDAFADQGFDMSAISHHPSPIAPHPIGRGQGEGQPVKWHLDLPECNRLQLMAAGIPREAIAVSPVCTFEQADDYFSARRLGINSGRIFTGIIVSTMSPDDLSV